MCWQCCAHSSRRLVGKVWSKSCPPASSSHQPAGRKTVSGSPPRRAAPRTALASCVTSARCGAHRVRQVGWCGRHSAWEISSLLSTSASTQNTTPRCVDTMGIDFINSHRTISRIIKYFYFFTNTNPAFIFFPVQWWILKLTFRWQEKVLNRLTHK